MRPSQKQNRARGRGNRNKPSGNVINRVFESAGPEGKVRGTPQQIIDKYLTLSRDAQTSGDRVMSENFLQHAEHYQRILLDAQGVREERRDQRQDHDGDGRDESGRDDSGRDDSGREDSGRDDSSVDEGEEVQASRQGERQGDGPRRGRRGRAEADQRDGRDRGQEAERQPDSRADSRTDSEVSGLTTIDSGPDEGESLLVEADELSASQPPRRRRNQRRDRGQQDQKSEADAQTE